MTDLLGQYIAGRERVHGRPGRLPFDVPDAAATLVESMGPERAKQWAHELIVELRADRVPTDLIINLSCVALENEADEEVIGQAVAILMGHV